MSSERITDSPEALWPVNDPVLNAAGIDTPSEPTMKLYFPNDEVFRAMDRISLGSAKLRLLNTMARIHDPNIGPGIQIIQ